MATKRTPGSRPGLIHCDHCGEEYSSSYRRCPFCDEYDEYEDSYESSSTRSERSSSRSSGGKRLAQSNRRGGGYTKVSPFRVIAYIISLAVILFAIWIVVAKIAPLIQQGDVTPPSDTSQTSDSDPTPDSSPDSSPDTPSDTSSDVDSDTDDGSDTTPDTDPSPSPSSSSPDEANGFSLNKSEFSFTSKYPDPVTLKVTFTPAGTTSQVTWSSSNTNYVTVDENGKVSPGPQKGTATITAALANGVTQTCTVHNQISGSGANQITTSAAGSYTINKSDFTFYTNGEKTKLSVVGYIGGVTWSSSNTSVATVSSDGTCTAVGNGKCTITGTLDNGTKVTAIARVNIS